jgi:hypothetical protein
MPGSTAQSIVAITHQGGLVHISDDPIRYKEEGDAPLVIDASAAGASQPTLFQDVFGKSAIFDFSSTAEASRDVAATSSSQKLDWELLDGPSHLLPSMQHLFSPLIQSMLQVSLSIDPQSQTRPTGHEDDMMVDSIDIDPVEDPIDGRSIATREINSFVGFFQDPTFTSMSLHHLCVLQTHDPQQLDHCPGNQPVQLLLARLNFLVSPMARPRPRLMAC